MSAVLAAAIGTDVPRHDARPKVQGAAIYAADRVPAGTLHASLATHDGPPGRLQTLDVSVAEAMPGVQLVLTYEKVGTLGAVQFLMAGGNAAQSWQPMQSDEIRYFGQAVALVVADTPEEARAAAMALRPVVAPANRVVLDMDDEGAEAFSLASASPMFKDKVVGDAAAAIRSAVTVVEARVSTPPQHQNPMELLATVAHWQDGQLTIHEPTQFAEGVRFGLATQLGLDPAHVRVVSPYVGGGFGQKNALLPHVAWVAIAARELGVPVKLVLSRQQMFSGASYRAPSEHRVRLGADASGKLVAAEHHVRTATSRFDAMPSMSTEVTSRIYDVAAFDGQETLVRVDTQTPGYMRSPFEAMGAFAFEGAVDDLAFQLGRDPVEYRLANLATRDPISGKPFSSNGLAECLKRGADAFGWARRTPGLRSMATDDTWVGWGCGVGAYKAALAPAEAVVAVHSDGTVRLSVTGHEMGQGIRTVAAQVASDRLGIAPDRIEVEVGVTGETAQHLSAGSWGSPSAAEAVAAACRALWAELGQDRAGGAPIMEVLARSGRNEAKARATAYPPGMDERVKGRVHSGLPTAAGPVYPDFVALAYAAHFVEVHVDRLTCTVRVPRALSVIDCGRVLSARTARSQALGGLVWGIGSALHDGTAVDRRAGGWLNRDLGEYLLPVNADIGTLDTILLDEADPRLGQIGAKGLGEVSMTGTAAAIANAVRHATGVRVTSLPIRMEELLHVQ